MKKIYILFLIVPILCIAWVAWNNQAPEPQVREKTLIVGEDTPRKDWCLRNIIEGKHGEVIIEEQQGGRYDYELYATSRGIEVWVPCE